MNYNQIDTLHIDDNYNHIFSQIKLVRKYRLMSLILGILFLICLMTLIFTSIHKKESRSPSNSSVLIQQKECNFNQSTSMNQNSVKSGCEHFTRMENWDYPHNDMLSMIVKDYNACCSMCWYQTSCMIFAYSPTSNRCWIKTEMIQNGGHHHLDRISGYISACQDANIINNRTFLNKNSLEDRPDESVMASNWRTCCGLCVHQKSCIAYTYSLETHQCWLKTEVNDEIDDPNTISGRVN